MNRLDLIIDALENSEPTGTGWVHVHEQKHQAALAAARELIAQPEQKLIGWKDGEPQYVAQPEQVSGDTSDGYHTFNELYDFRKAYNAALFNEWAASGKYSVHKSKRHFDGRDCFGGGWFIVVAQLPEGQISNHYEMKDWDKFQLPETDKALFEYDDHTGADVLRRLFSLRPFAQPEQEPVAWMDKEDCGDMTFTLIKPTYDNDLIPLYAAPPKPEQESISTNKHLCAMLRQVHDVLACTALPMKRSWQGLTDEDINKSWEWAQKSSPYGVTRIETFAKSIETKLKEKNGAI